MQKLQPKLRFPQFEKDWEIKKLGDFTNWSSGGTPSKQNSGFWNGKIPWISATSMRGTVYSDSELKITELGLRKGSRLAKKGTLLILVRGSMLFNKIPIGITGVDVAFNQDLKSIEVQKDSFSTFILYWFSHKEHFLLDLVTATGIGAGKLDLRELKNLTINLPSLPEQTKIASFLTTVDEKIAGLKKQLTLLERYKKGVMQKIFSQKLRFKDENGNDFPDWEKLAISQLFDSKKGSGLSKDKLSNTGKYKCLLYGELFTTYKEKITSIVSFTNSLEGVCVDENDILVPGSTTTSGIDLSKFSALKVSDVRVGGDVTILKSKKKIEPVFYAYYLSNFKKREIGNKAQGITIVHLSFSNFKDIIIDFPSFTEQAKIATFLSSIDDKLEKCQGQIKAMESWKKGLLQQMFV